MRLSTLLGIGAMAMALGGCDSTGSTRIGGALSDTDGWRCIGDPDGSVICGPPEGLWTCETLAGGARKCALTPDGEGGWQCTQTADGLSCSSHGSSGPVDGGGLWSCEGGESQTRCDLNGSSDVQTPPGTGAAVCEVVEFGLVCRGSSTGEGATPPINPDDDDDTPCGCPQPKDEPKQGEFRTQTQGGWGAPARGNNPGTYRDAHFDGAFGDGLTIGCAGGFALHFESAAAVEHFLPAGGTPSALSADATDPSSSSAGVLAGQVLALSLSVGFDAYDDNFGASTAALSELVAGDGPCAGLSVGQILEQANAVLGGCDSGFSASAINGCVDAVNNAFVDGQRAGGHFHLP